MVLNLFHKKASSKNQPRRPVNLPGRDKPAFSYYTGEGRPSEADTVRNRQVKQKQRETVNKLRKAPTMIALAAILISVVYSTTLSSTPRLIFAGQASPYHTAKDYQKTINELFGGSILNKNKLSINAGKMQDKILTTFPELDVVRVVLPVIGRRPTVVVHARQPLLILTTKTNALILDSSGKAVSSTSQVLSETITALLKVQDDSGLAIKVGDQALNSDSIAFIDNVGKQLADKKLTITGLTLPKVANELDIHIKDQAYYIKTDMTGDARLQIGAYLAAKGSGAAPAEYMDVRVEEKVFYK